MNEFLGPWVKALRKRLDLRQTDLAELLGVSVESVSRWELGMTQPWASKLLLLFAVATEQEIAGLLKYGELDDQMKFRLADGSLVLASCLECGGPMYVHAYAKRGWPAPPLVQDDATPYAIRKCAKCQVF
jgi:transcriptional regulator with XRE-family HTH domain